MGFAISSDGYFLKFNVAMATKQNGHWLATLLDPVQSVPTTLLLC